MKPKNKIEAAAAKCDLQLLEKKLKRIKEPEVLSKYIRTDVITVLMRIELKNWRRETKERKMINTLKFLVARGLDFSGTNKRGTKSALMREANFGSFKLCRFLIDYGKSNVNLVDGDGNTALFYALKTNTDRSAKLDQNASTRRYRIVGLLLDNNVGYGRKLSGFLLREQESDVFEKLIERCVDAKVEGETGKIVQSVFEVAKLTLTDVKQATTAYERMIKMIQYDVEQRVKMLEYVGCLVFPARYYPSERHGRMEYRVRYTAVLSYWKRAVDLKAEHGIAESGLPDFPDFDEFRTEIFRGDVFNRMMKMNAIFFRVMSKIKNEKLISGVATDIYMDCFAPIDHKYFRYTAECFYYVNWTPEHKLGVCPLQMRVELGCAMLLSAKDSTEMKTTKKMIADLVRFNKNEPLLHRAAYKIILMDWWPARCEIYVRMARLMLQEGLNVHAKDKKGETALQDYVQMTTPWKREQLKVVELFVEFGAHVDEKCGERRVYEKLKRFDLERKYMKLKCLVARKIVDENIDYAGKLPRMLQTFIEIHKL